jgi:hypothetical protein
MATAVANHGGHAAVRLLNDLLASLPDVADTARVEASREACRELALDFRRHVDELVEWATNELDEEPD